MKTVQMAPLTTFKQRAASLGLGLGLAATMALSAVMPALAADGTVPGSINVNGGGYSVAATGNQAEFTVLLDGGNQTTTDTFGLATTDATGSGAGWDVQITVGTFAEVLDSTKTINVSPKITGVAIETGSTGTAPSDSGLAARYASGAKVDVSSTAKVFGADAGTGLGASTITPTMQITVPANAHVDSVSGGYTGTITVTMAAPLVTP